MRIPGDQWGKFWNYVIPDGSTTAPWVYRLPDGFWNYVIPDGSTTIMYEVEHNYQFWNYVIPDGSTTKER